MGDKLQVKTKFADDETNTETKTVMLMKVGGQQGTGAGVDALQHQLGTVQLQAQSVDLRRIIALQGTDFVVPV